MKHYPQITNMQLTKGLRFTKGFSLVEVMTAITLSLVLIAGVVQMYISGKESYRLQYELGRMQENQRLALEYLQRDLHRAGFFINDDPTNPNLNHIEKFFTGNDADGLVSTRDGGNGAAANNGYASDVMTVRFESNRDCLGNDITVTDGGGVPIYAVADGNIYVLNQYYIEDGNLMCRGNVDADGKVLISGVSSMQILYGEDTDPPVAGVVPTANRYVKAEQANLNRVVSVRISLLFSSENSIKPQVTTHAFQLLDGPSFNLTDNKRHQVVTTTIQLRNNT